MVFEKEWGNISGDVYGKHVVPAIYAYKEEVEQYAGRGNVILMEDGVLSHIAKATKILYDRNDVWRMKWPAHASPGVRFRRVVHRDCAEGTVLVKKHVAEICATNADRILKHRLEYRL